MTYLRKHPKSGVYYFRRTVPPALREALGKGTDWYESLGTKDLAEAKKKAKVVGQRVDAAFDAARAKLDADPSAVLTDSGDWLGPFRDWPTTPTITPPAFDTLTLTDAETMAQEWARDQVRRFQEVVAGQGIPASPQPTYGPVPPPPPAWGMPAGHPLQIMIARQTNRPRDPRLPLEVLIVRPDLDDFPAERIVWELGQRFQVNLEPGSQSWRFLRNSVLRAEKTVQAKVERIKAGDWALPLDAPPRPPVATEHAARPAVHGGKETSAKPGRTLTEVYRMYAAEVGVNPKMALEHDTILKRFQDILGGDLPVREICKEHVVEFKSILFRLPKSMTAAQKKNPLRLLAAETDGKDVKRLTNTSVRKSVSIVQTILGWGVKNGLLDTNPVLGVVPAKTKRAAGPPRLFFSENEIKTIFTSPIYSGCKSDARYWIPGTHRIADERAWLPVLALWTGCRLEELGQLLAGDLKQEGEIWFLELTTISDDENGPVKRLKNEGSHRRVPLHPEVIKAGFLEYAKVQKGVRLFPNLKADRVGVLTSGYSKAFGRYLDRIGLSDSRKTFHSFRHSFKRACRGVIDKEIHAALTGHATGDVGDLYGRDEAGVGVPLVVLAQAMARLEIPGWPADFQQIA